jgi:hypothetical protein
VQSESATGRVGPTLEQIGSRNNLGFCDAGEKQLTLESAIQLLVWAIEEIARTGNKQAEHHARLALKYREADGKRSA